MNNQGEENNLWRPEDDQPSADDSSTTQESAIDNPNPPQTESEPTAKSSSDKIKDIDPIEINWTAGDSIEHQRGKTWYLMVVAVVVIITAGLAALAFYKIFSLMTSITTEILVVVMMIALFVVTRQPPREVKYILTDAGLIINGQLHLFSEYRAFGVHKIGAMWQLVLIPVKRFGMSTTMFIHQDQGERIVDELGAHLPMEEVKPDVVDNLINKLKI